MRSIPFSAQVRVRDEPEKPSPDRDTGRLAEPFELTADQQAKVIAVPEDGFTRRAELKPGFWVGREMAREIMNRPKRLALKSRVRVCLRFGGGVFDVEGQGRF